MVEENGWHRALVGLSRHLFPLRLAVYLREMATLRLRQPQHFHSVELVRRFGPWQRTIASGDGPLADERPWIVFAAIEFLQSILSKEMNVFEYGSGGSTVFLARRCKSVVSVEHDADWYPRVRDGLAQRQLHNVKLQLIEAIAPADSRDAGDPDGYVSSDPQYLGRSFRRYCSSIDDVAPGFDLVSVDGRARPSCIRHGSDKVMRGGYLMLDNAERTSYARAAALLDDAGWQRTDFIGPAPYTFGFSQTTFWRRPA